MKQNNGEFSIKDFINFMFQQFWLIVLCAIVGGFAGFFYSNSNNTVTYSYSSSYFVEAVSGNTSNVGVAKQRVPLYMELISNNRDFHQKVLEALGEENRVKYGFSRDVKDLASLKKMSSMIRTQQSGDLEMFSVHVIAPTEECAELISTTINDNINFVNDKIEATCTITCKDTPRSNGAASSNNPKTSLMIGAFAGGMLSVITLWLYLAFDNRIRNRRSLELNFDLPILGVIPKVEADSMTNEAYFESARRAEDEQA